ncbi:MAG: N-acetyl-gamma-glutamyl-phosphate reductase [Umezawaea sp.]
MGGKGRDLVVGVVGAAGYTGGELCRLLLGHPDVGTILPAVRDDRSFDCTHPNLTGSGLAFTTVDDLEARAAELDVVFFCTPTGHAMLAARRYLDAGAIVVDLSADFRFADPAAFERAHGVAHAAPDLLDQAVYGATELYRDQVRKARLVANPGCYALTAVLALAPLLDALGDGIHDVAVHAVNGTTGAGTTPKKDLAHAEVFGSMLAYSLEGHRHGPELEAVFGELTGHDVGVDLNTTHGNFARGIHLQANVRLTGPTSRADLLETYTRFYGTGHDGEFFVLVNDNARTGKINDKQYDLYPRLANVVGSNFCHLGLDHDADRNVVKVVAVTDNLVKGAAGSAIQNMNVALGLDETAGLRGYAL